MSNYIGSLFSGYSSRPWSKRVSLSKIATSVFRLQLEKLALYKKQPNLLNLTDDKHLHDLSPSLMIKFRQMKGQVITGEVCTQANEPCQANCNMGEDCPVNEKVPILIFCSLLRKMIPKSEKVYTLSVGILNLYFLVAVLPYASNNCSSSQNVSAM